MGTGNVRIFELAKELGLSSKELIGLFGRLGLEAKNQLSVVDAKIADLVRGVLLGSAGAAAPAASPAPPAPAPPASAKPRPQPQKAPAPRPVVEEEIPVPTLRPVTAPQRRPRPEPAEPARPQPVAVDEPPVQPQVVAAVPVEIETPAASAEQPAPEPAAETKRPARPPRPAPSPEPVAEAPVPQLKPVPRGQSSIVPPRQETPPPNGTSTGVAASAAPGPRSGIPGRPGVAPRPGQPGIPGQGYQSRPLAPGQRAGAAGAAGATGAPPRPNRPLSNGPFRPLTGPAASRPFVPRPGQPAAPATPGSGGPMPSGGARGGQTRSRDRDDPVSKKDREKDLLLEKERQRKKRAPGSQPAQATAVLETIEIPDVLTVQELATSMIMPAKEVIKELIKTGTMATINQNIPSDIAQQVARKFGFNAVVKEAGEEVVVEQEEDQPGMLSERPPVVTVLGHVDHGKTSLLDRMREANVAAGEAGGITQRIGAYTVEHGDKKITFIDTPGHEAFTAMRARGAKVTDVAILVVAADDGVMPQTIEAISHIKAANVPIVVAINKMDKEDAQPDRVRSQLAEQGLNPVEWGGTTEMVLVSARSGDGIDKLLETVLLEADLRELRANRNRRATGVVIESALDRGRGAVATVLVQNGTLRTGDVVVVGGAYGKIRALVDDKGKQVRKAGPSIPVEVSGLSDVPSAGDALMVVSDERVAREAAAKRAVRRQDLRIAASGGPRVSLESFMSMPASGGQKTLNLVLKADGQGAVEALRARMQGLSNGEVDIRVIYAGVGAITPNDVNLASASNAVLIGFNIRPDETVKRLAENEQVDLRFYQVIYDVENDLRKAMVGMLAPKFREIILGRAQVREVFKVSKIGTIAGCYVQSGKLIRNSKVRILRDGAFIYDSELASLRRFKEDVKEVADGFECGVQVAKFSDLKVGDEIEAYTSELVAPEPALV
jgi:translation initiation factor IF-2